MHPLIISYFVRTSMMCIYKNQKNIFLVYNYIHCVLVLTVGYIGSCGKTLL